jgi:hypothetical protein
MLKQMKKLILFLTIIALTACKDSEPKVTMPEPPDTQVIEVVESDYFFLNYDNNINNAIYISDCFYGNNFGDNYAKFCTVGEVQNLGYITEIPADAVWTDNTEIVNMIHIKKGYGYIADVNGIYYRLFVKDIRKETTVYGMINVYTIHYQFPFIPE